MGRGLPTKEFYISAGFQEGIRLKMVFTALNRNDPPTSLGSFNGFFQLLTVTSIRYAIDQPSLILFSLVNNRSVLAELV